MTVTFLDPDGVLWDAWQAPRPKGPRDRGGAADAEVRPALCFCSANETRRLADCPANWSVLPTPALAQLCRRAPVVSRTTPARMADGLPLLGDSRPA